MESPNGSYGCIGSWGLLARNAARHARGMSGFPPPASRSGRPGNSQVTAEGRRQRLPEGKIRHVRIQLGSHHHPDRGRTRSSVLADHGRLCRPASGVARKRSGLSSAGCRAALRRGGPGARASAAPAAAGGSRRGTARAQRTGTSSRRMINTPWGMLLSSVESVGVLPAEVEKPPCAVLSSAADARRSPGAVAGSTPTRCWPACPRTSDAPAAEQVGGPLSVSGLTS